MSEELSLIVASESTWSIRALLCLKIAGLECSENVISLSGEKKRLKELSETQLVPVLLHGALKVYDSLAIAEYINELRPGSLYPQASNKRAIARSLCAELHSGFSQLRVNYPFSLGQSQGPERTPAINHELNRLTTIWSMASGDFYDKEAGVVDAFYSVLAYRLATYGITLSGRAGEYQQSLLDWDLFKECMVRATTWSCSP